MLKLAFGFLIAVALGAFCRFFDLPVPSPPTLLGALLVAAVTLGYVAADRLLPPRVDHASTSATLK